MMRIETMIIIAPLDDDAYGFRIALVVHPTKAEDNILKRTSTEHGDGAETPISLYEGCFRVEVIYLG